MSGHLRRQNGFTVVELILVIAVLGFIMAAAAAFFVFGTRTFSTGSSQARVQQEARLAAGMVGQDLRTAIEVELYTTETMPVAEADQFVVQRIGDAPPYALSYSRPGIGTSVTDNLFTELSFGVTEGPNGKKFIVFTAVGTDRGRNYTTDATMLLENDHPALIESQDMTVILFRR